MKKVFLQLICASLLLMCGTVEATAEVVLVVAKDSPIESLSRHEVDDVYLGRARSLPKFGKVIPLDRSEDKIREEFYKGYTGMNLAQVKSHWAKNIFTGRGYPPKVVANIDELKDALQKNPNAIGYISSEMVDGSLKVVKTE